MPGFVLKLLVWGDDGGRKWRPWWWRKTHEESCFCGLKAAIRKSGIAENPHRLFRACPRYRKGSHCNYFKWVEDDEYEGVGEGGTKKNYGAELQVDSDCDEWRLKVAWRLGSLEAEVKA
ncbi:uncharacterized protein DS421_15g489340 [Arachis hypogaea]|nr:uncharacterized protein DS421_15g489340 [Arachis hypogaea]